MSTGELSPEQEAAFMADLTELSRKHGITIGGCGCCGSPWLAPITTPKEASGKYELEDGQLTWVDAP